VCYLKRVKEHGADPRRNLADLFGFLADDTRDSRPSRPGEKTGRDASESAKLGEACLEEGDYDGAVRHFRKALEQGEPGDVRRRIDLAGALEAADRASEAMREYGRAAKASAEAPEPHVGLSDVYRRYGHFRDALRELERAIELEPDNAFYRFKMAELLRDLGERRAAVKYAQRAVELADGDGFYPYWLGDLLIEMRQFDDAVSAMRSALELLPGDDFLYYRASVALWGANRQKEAIQAVRLAGELNPEKHFYHGLLALYLRESGDAVAADQEWARCAKMDAYDRAQLDDIARFLDVKSLTV